MKCMYVYIAIYYSKTKGITVSVHKLKLVVPFIINKMIEFCYQTVGFLLIQEPFASSKD